MLKALPPHSDGDASQLTPAAKHTLSPCQSCYFSNLRRSTELENGCAGSGPGNGLVFALSVIFIQ